MSQCLQPLDEQTSNFPSHPYFLAGKPSLLLGAWGGGARGIWEGREICQPLGRTLQFRWGWSWPLEGFLPALLRAAIGRATCERVAWGVCSAPRAGNVPQPSLWVPAPQEPGPPQPSMHREWLGTSHLPPRWGGTRGQCSLAMPWGTTATGLGLCCPGTRGQCSLAMPWGTTAAGLGLCCPGSPGGTVPLWELVLTSWPVSHASLQPPTQARACSSPRSGAGGVCLGEARWQGYACVCSEETMLCKQLFGSCCCCCCCYCCQESW